MSRNDFVCFGISSCISTSVLAQIYYFKPQTLAVSTLFLLVLSYWFGNAMAMALPSRGIFRWINPGPFNSKCPVAFVRLSCSS